MFNNFAIMSKYKSLMVLTMAMSGPPKENPEEKDSLTADLVIVGSGPGGLIAAVLLSKHKKIVIIESREEKWSSIRPQLVRLKPQIREYLKTFELTNKTLLDKEEIENEKSFLKQLDDKHEHVAIKDVQRYLKRRIKEEKNTIFLYDSKVSKIDMKSGRLTIDSKLDHPHTIHFDSMIAADGVAHHTANKLIESGHPIRFEKTFESKHQYFISCYFLVKPTIGKTLEDITDFVLHRSIDNQGICYIYYHHASYHKSQHQQLKFYVTSTVSLDHFNQFREQKEAGIKFLIKKAAQVFPLTKHQISPVKPSAKSGLLKDNLKYQAFARQFFQANVAGISVPSEEKDHAHHCLLVGEAFKNSDFFQGNGANFAILQGGLAAKHILDESYTLENYNNESEALGREHLELTKASEKFIQHSIEKSENKICISLLLTTVQTHINETKALQKKESSLLPQVSQTSLYTKDLQILRMYRDAILESKNDPQQIFLTFEKIAQSLEQKPPAAPFFKTQLNSKTQKIINNLHETLKSHLSKKRLLPTR